MKKLFTKTASVAMGLCLLGNSAIGQSTIFDIVAGSPNHTILETALIQQGLNTTLSDANVNYTLFAPTDSAFNVYLAANNLTAAQLLANTELTNILLHHVLGTEVFAAGLSNGEVTTLNGLDVTVNLSGGAKIDSAAVLTPDLDASNGVVHSIGGDLLPRYDDVTEVVAKSANHTTLLAALTAANLVTTLQDLSKTYTVFAPTNAAFDAYLAANNLTAAQLLAAPNLSDILLQHVLGVKAVSSGLTNGEVTTLHGKDVTVDITSGVKIDAATVTTADIEAGNGVVHVLDGVLLPTFDDVTEVVSLSADHTTLLAALQQANLVTTLQDLSKTYTVFAPTNAAFDAYLAANNLTAAQLLAAPNLSNILLNHVLGSEVLAAALTNGPVKTLNGTDVVVDITSGVKIDAATVTTSDIKAGNGAVHVLDAVLSINAATSSVAVEGNALIKLFPNPTTNFITLENVTTGSVVNILNIQGQIVKSVVFSQNTIDVSDLPAGRYLIRSFSAVASFIKK